MSKKIHVNVPHDWTDPIEDGVHVTVKAGTYYLADIVAQFERSLAEADGYRVHAGTVIAPEEP